MMDVFDLQPNSREKAATILSRIMRKHGPAKTMRGTRIRLFYALGRLDCVKNEQFAAEPKKVHSS
jgi:hypothetical protein